MSETLVGNAAVVVTVDDARRELAEADILIRDGVIAAVGHALVAPGAEAAGSRDPVAALILCGPTRVRDLFVEGRRVVAEGQVITIDLPKVIARKSFLAQKLRD